jgi:uncharacterized protein (TIGR00303 family)
MFGKIRGDAKLSQELAANKADFMLALCNSATADIEGITQAGLPGRIYLTPTLDAEYLASGTVPSLGEIPETPAGVPTPALMSRAVELLSPFASVSMLDLGLRVKPLVGELLVPMGIQACGNIATQCRIEAREIFYKGVEYARSVEPVGEYIILAESVPSGTTTAEAAVTALGYECRGLFSSSFADSPLSVKRETIEAAVKRVEEESCEGPFEKLSLCSDNMLLFCAGMVAGFGGRYPLVLGGGTQMAAVALIADTLAQHEGLEIASSKLCLWTTKWVAEDEKSDIGALLDMLSFELEASYPIFDFSSSSHPALALYDRGEAKEGVGAGASILYALGKGLKVSDIVASVEEQLGGI